MKLSWKNSTVSANRWRCGVTLSAAVCIVWAAFISSSAQLKAEKHVTSVEMVQLAQGARVTVNADSALNDYEAFRRGDRFYVKIPLAAFSFSQPRFKGNGFDDVQVQKVGDSVVVSFKLQLGASARVEQHANRLEVIFTALNRGQNASVGLNRPASLGIKDASGNQGNQDRQRDAAGPGPSDASESSRQRYASAPSHEINAAQHQSRNERLEKNQNRTSSVDNHPLASSTPIGAASPTPVSSYPAASSYTPAASTPVASSKPAIVSTSSTNSKLRAWFSANRKATLLVGLILAGLLAAAAYFYRVRRTEFDDRRAKRPLSQPKYESEVALEEMTESPAERELVVPPVIQEATKSEWRSAASKPAFEPAAEVAVHNASVFSKPSNSSVVVADNKSGDEEREVFEL
jgi:hypothetical protein